MHVSGGKVWHRRANSVTGKNKTWDLTMYEHRSATDNMCTAVRFYDLSTPAHLKSFIVLSHAPTVDRKRFLYSLVSFLSTLTRTWVIHWEKKMSPRVLTCLICLSGPAAIPQKFQENCLLVYLIFHSWHKDRTAHKDLGSILQIRAVIWALCACRR